MNTPSPVNASALDEARCYRAAPYLSRPKCTDRSFMSLTPCPPPADCAKDRSKFPLLSSCCQTCPFSRQSGQKNFRVTYENRLSRASSSGRGVRPVSRCSRRPSCWGKRYAPRRTTLSMRAIAVYPPFERLEGVPLEPKAEVSRCSAAPRLESPRIMTQSPIRAQAHYRVGAGRALRLLEPLGG